jgi:hypothetical protein
MPLRSPSSERQPAWWARSWAGLAGLSAIFLAANLQLLTGAATEHLDGKQFFAPFFAYLASVVRSGHWLLWNPLSNAGSPDFAEPQIGALSPLTLAFAALAGPGALAFRLYWLALWLLGGFGMYAYARTLGAPAWGRFLAGAAWVFSGFYLGHGQHTSVVHSISFLPWIVWRLDRALLTARRRPALEAGALWGLSALAGNPAITISTGLFVGACVLVRVWSGATRLRQGAIVLGLFAAVGAIVCAPAYFSFKYESLGYSDRSGPLPRVMALESNALAPRGLAAMLDPYVPGLAVANAGPGESAAAVSPMYFGAAPLALGLLALLLPGDRRWRWGLCGVGLLFLGCALGSNLPLRGWLYDLAPPTRYFRHPNMFRAFFIFAMIALAANATGQLPRWPRRRLALIAAVLAVAGIGALLFFSASAARRRPDAHFAWLHSTGAWLGLAVICAVAARWPVRLPGPLVALTTLDLLGAHYLSADFAYAIGRSDLPRPAVQRSPVDLGPENFARAVGRLGNPQLYLHVPVYCSYAALLNVEHLRSAELGALTPFATGRDRLWFSPTVLEAPVSSEAIAQLTLESAARGAPVLLWHPRDELLRASGVSSPFAGSEARAASPASPLDPDAIRRAPTAVRVPFSIETYRANELALRATCPSDGWLLVTDRWSRSWRATVNGAPVPIDGGNFFFRLVPVRAGENVVEMRFEPFLLWPLLTASWGTLLVVAGAAAVARWRRAAPLRPIHPAPAEPCAVFS